MTNCSTWIQLTPDGVALAEHAVRVNSAAHAQVFDGVPADVVATATAALRVFTATARVRRGGTAARNPRGRSMS